MLGSTIEPGQYLPLENFNSYLDKNNLMEKWVLMNTPWPLLSILLAYLVFVLRVGPRYMASRSAYSITNIMRLYNICQVIYNGFMVFYVFFKYTNFIPQVWQASCKVNQNYDYEYLAGEYALYGWHFTTLKILDLLDTVFMVFRKKNSHITFLHVYHHVAMAFFSWLCMRHFKAPQSAFPGLLNLFVHTVMYSYYFLATFSNLRPYLWWKKHLTKLQLGQFVCILAYLSILYYKGCHIPPVFAYIWIFNMVVFMFLFSDFYFKAYILKKDSSRKKE